MRNMILAVLLAFLLVLLGSGSAYADDYPVYVPGEGLNDYGNGHYMLAPVSNAFNAALWLMGENDKYPQLTDAQLALLSNEDTGGAFYDLALKFSSVADQGYPSWAEIKPLDVNTWQVHMDFSICSSAYGESHVWYCTADNADIQNARRDFLKVYNNEVSGGSGFGDKLTFTTLDACCYSWANGDPSVVTSVNVSLDNASPYHLNVDGSEKAYYLPYYVNASRPECSKTFDVGVPDGFFDNIISKFDDTYNACLVKWTYYRRGSWYADFYLVNRDSLGNMVFTTTVNGESKSYLCGKTFSGRTSGIPRQYFYYDAGMTDVYSLPQYFKITDDMSSYQPGNSYSTANTGTYTSAISVFDKDGYIGGDPVVPPNNWPDPTPPQPQPEPDPPEVPQPPELPTPWNPTIPEPDPPEPINPYTPIVEPEPTGTTPNDYTPWLRAILAALNRIIVDLATHCQHIQNAIRNASTYLVDAIGDYAEYLAGKLHYELTTIIADLESYLANLAQWLADELDFDRDSEVYDDARLMRILLDIRSRLGDLDSAISDLSAQLGDIYVRLGQILAKIGSGGGGRPTPTTEPEVDEGFDFWQWLLDLITNKLGDIITDFVGDIGWFLDELVSKFPFSIPWDIMAYIALLDANRVTPVITFVIPSIDGWWAEQRLVIDLAPYDDAMAAVRSMMLIVWGFILVMKTDWLGKVFDDAVQVVVGFFDRLAGHGSGA